MNVDKVVNVRRGRGRPPKEFREFRWSEVPSAAFVEVDGEKGPWVFVKMCDGGESVTVVGGPMGHTRSFSVDRVSVKIKELMKDDEGV